MTLRELKPQECRRFLGQYEDTVFTVVELSVAVGDPYRYIVVRSDAFGDYASSAGRMTKEQVENIYNIKLDDRTGLQDPSAVVPVQQEESQVRGSVSSSQ